MKRFLSLRAALTAAACVSAAAAAACASNAPHTDLSGTSWRVESVDGHPNSAPTLEFAEDRVSGSGGCNRFAGGYTSGDGRISFTGVAVTRMACLDEVMQREDDFLAALNAVASYRRDGDRLTLTSADGRAIELSAH